MEDKNLKNLTPDNFEFVQRDDKIYDKKFETKPIGYFKDAMIRFGKNRTNVIATTILFIIILCSIIIPMVSDKNVDDYDGNWTDLPPRMPFFEDLGIFDGTRSYTDQVVDFNRTLSTDSTLYLPKQVKYEDLIVEGSLTNYSDACSDANDSCVGGQNTLRIRSGFPYTTIISPVDNAGEWVTGSNDPYIEINVNEFVGEGTLELYYLTIQRTQLEGQDTPDDETDDKWEEIASEMVLVGTITEKGTFRYYMNDFDNQGGQAFFQTDYFKLRYSTDDVENYVVFDEVIIGEEGTQSVSNITEGRMYQIATVGTTDYTLLGAKSNTVGEIFEVNFDDSIIDPEDDEEFIDGFEIGDGTVSLIPVFWTGYSLSEWEYDRFETGNIQFGNFSRQNGVVTYSSYEYREYDAIFYPEVIEAYPASKFNEKMEAYGYENEGDICYSYHEDPENTEDDYLKPEYYPRYTTNEKCPIKRIVSTTKIEWKDGVPYFSYIVEASTMQLEGFEEMPYFLFGTDSSGRDLFTLLFIATRTSLMLGVIVAAINITIGVIYGSISGYYGGKTDLIMQRISEVIGRIPWLVTLSIMVSLFGPGIETLILILIVSGWIGIAAVTRTQFYRYKGREYVLASRTLGAKDGRLIFRHILPNGIGTIITASILSVPYVIFAESTISYLGYGIGKGQSFTLFGIEFSGASVGVLLAEGRPYLQSAPYITLFPAALISILMITFNMFGNALRDAFNPALRGTE
jgi:ABC-type dipeptide/oligopeptide/nickel transport system permease subunit